MSSIFQKILKSLVLTLINGIGVFCVGISQGLSVEVSALASVGVVGGFLVNLSNELNKIDKYDNIDNS